jgi:hypothetical protein
MLVERFVLLRGEAPETGLLSLPGLKEAKRARGRERLGAALMSTFLPTLSLLEL